MDRILLLVTVTIIATTAAKAQSVTYNHDSPKQNQVTVMETGTGALSPDLYYSILHNKYKKSAAVKNKLSFRTLAGVNLYNQTDEAEAIDSALVSRAKIEALNVADRQADIAWVAEGDKVNGQMVRFKRNIDRICDFYRLAGTVLVDTTNVHGTGCPVRYCDGSGNGVQDDGET